MADDGGSVIVCSRDKGERDFVVFGTARRPAGEPPVDRMYLLACGCSRARVGGMVDISLACAPEPGTLGSVLSSRLTAALVDCEDELFICYDLTMSEPGLWLSQLRSTGFSVCTQPYSGTGRQVAICAGKGDLLTRIDWLQQAMPFDSTFLASSPQLCSDFIETIMATGIPNIFGLAVHNPVELWALLGNTGIFAYIGGDEGDLFVVRMRGSDEGRFVHSIKRVSRELDISLYDAGEVTGWGEAGLVLAGDEVACETWCPLPHHWHQI